MSTKICVQKDNINLYRDYELMLNEKNDAEDIPKNIRYNFYH